jgi:hypothetical protein
MASSLYSMHDLRQPAAVADDPRGGVMPAVGTCVGSAWPARVPCHAMNKLRRCRCALSWHGTRSLTKASSNDGRNALRPGAGLRAGKDQQFLTLRQTRTARAGPDSDQ